MGTPTNNFSDDDRVKASIENWKRKLLDLTKRNRALNFKVHKVSTVTVVDEQPAEVFRQLYLREKSMRFKAAPEPDNPKKTQEQNGSLFQTVYLDQPDVDGQLFKSDSVSLFEEADEDEIAAPARRASPLIDRRARRKSSFPRDRNAALHRVGKLRSDL